ncbi:MAG: hypothetical protein HQK83_14420 [Fibrobacteria bacterium]|nr:hypothetical protein [Fibrobacteria bacterium]
MIRILVILMLISNSMQVFGATETGKFTIGFWGDAKSNIENAFVNVATYLVNSKGTKIDVHFMNGDFTPNGTTADWKNAFSLSNVRKACVKDYFFMSTSNHDSKVPANYQANMGTLLPSNGINNYYYHRSWDVIGGERKVRLLVFDLYLTSTAEEQISYFREQLEADGHDPKDWICAMWHAPSFPDMTYKWVASSNEHEEFKAKFVNFLLEPEIGGDFVFNGHAHNYLRTHLLGDSGVLIDTISGKFGPYRSPDSLRGLIHIVNGRAGAFNNTSKNWVNSAYAPAFNGQQGLVTRIAFDDSSATLVTDRIQAGGVVDKGVDSWKWTKFAPPVDTLPLDTTDTTGVDTTKTDTTVAIGSANNMIFDAIHIEENGKGGVTIEVPFAVSHTIRVFNLQGKQLNRFVGHMPGKYQWQHPAGKTGIYYFEINIDGKKQIKRVLLLK